LKAEGRTHLETRAYKQIHAMEIRTYHAESVHAALQMVREELGPDAFVLRTREVRAGGLLGLISGRRCMEVTASLDRSSGPWLRPLGPLDRGIDLCQHSYRNHR